MSHFGASLHIEGVIALSQGFVFTSMIFAAIIVSTIDRRFDRAAIWTFVAALLAYIGIIHAYRLTPLGVQNHFGFGAAKGFALMYALMALVFWLMGLVKTDISTDARS